MSPDTNTLIEPEALLQIPIWMGVLLAAFFAAIGAAGACFILHTQRTRR